MPLPVHLVHVSVARPAREVYAFASNPSNLSRWAAGLSDSALVPDGDGWVANSPMGRVRIQFTPRNALGVIDHTVTLPDGTAVSNPLRVQSNDRDADVIFTLHRRAGVSEKDFQDDIRRVQDDLQRLKAILESHRDSA